MITLRSWVYDFSLGGLLLLHEWDHQDAADLTRRKWSVQCYYQGNNHEASFKIRKTSVGMPSMVDLVLWQLSFPISLLVEFTRVMCGRVSFSTWSIEKSMRFMTLECTWTSLSTGQGNLKDFCSLTMKSLLRRSRPLSSWNMQRNWNSKKPWVRNQGRTFLRLWWSDRSRISSRTLWCNGRTYSLIWSINM